MNSGRKSTNANRRFLLKLEAARKCFGYAVVILFGIIVLLDDLDFGWLVVRQSYWIGGVTIIVGAVLLVVSILEAKGRDKSPN